MNTHSILFNVASTTCIKLSSAHREAVYDYFYQVVNGDNLYTNPRREQILEAYYELKMSAPLGLNWIDHVSYALEELHLCRPYLTSQSRCSL